MTRVLETRSLRWRQISVCFKFFLIQLVTWVHLHDLRYAFISLVPNGPAEADSEPPNQMSWKEGRQLLRKYATTFTLNDSRTFFFPGTVLRVLPPVMQVPWGSRLFRHHPGHALQTRALPAGAEQPGGQRAPIERQLSGTRTPSGWRLVVGQTNRRTN